MALQKNSREEKEKVNHVVSAAHNVMTLSSVCRKLTRQGARSFGLILLVICFKSSHMFILLVRLVYVKT